MNHQYSRPKKRQKMGLRVSERIESRGHLQWIRGRNCCVANADFGPGAIVCSGTMDAHHVRTRGAGGGDEQVVPLCRAHHSQLDSPWCGPKTFEAIYKVNLAELAAGYWKADTYHRAKAEARLAMEKE